MTESKEGGAPTVADASRAKSGVGSSSQDPITSSGEHAFDIVEWTIQTTLPEFIEENIHDIDDAIALGRKFVELEEDVWKAIGFLGLHVEKGEGGRGYEGGVSKFAHGIGRPNQTVFRWMSAVSGKEKLPHYGEVSKELPQAHYRMIDKAEDPEPIIEFIAETIEDTGKIPSVAHVAHATGNSEWYTPPEYIEAAKRLMGSIEVDPASSDKANEIVGADIYYTKENDGLSKKWYGNVWMNPPYSQPTVSAFCNQFVENYRAGEITQGCVFVNNATETAFMQNMLSVCAAICLVRGRVAFLDPEGNPGNPLQGQTLLYFGDEAHRFAGIFKQFGVVLFAR